MLLHTDHKHMHLTTSAYIENVLHILGISSRKSSTSIASPIDTDSSLFNIGQKREYSTALGMLSWLTQPARCDVSCTSSSPEQHRATATLSTLNVAAQNATADDMWYANLEEDNLADLFTKILSPGDFIRLRNQLLHPAPM